MFTITENVKGGILEIQFSGQDTKKNLIRLFVVKVMSYNKARLPDKHKEPVYMLVI